MSAAFFILLGIVFSAFGIIDLVEYGETDASLFIGGIALAYGIFGFWRARRMPLPSVYPPGHCRKCGYDMTGNLSGNCPECGAPGHAP
ncbi:MAG: hypothetical protein JSU63_20695 [Phycisphaerales bacterium]|nr:MAG: hypothetical protein JSU63_20695 [Phycisphaerales bacterium]